MNNYQKNQSGQVFVIILIVLGLIVLNTLLIIGGSVTYLQSTNQDIKKNEATNLAEAGIDKAVASLNATAGTYNGESETTLGAGSYSVSVTSLDASSDLIQSTGYVPNKTHPVSTETIKIQVSKGTGISFVYGMLIGNGGISMLNNSRINGSVYSNGNIAGRNNELITGDVFVAGGTQPTADQQSDCTNLNCNDFIFGKNVTGNNQLDVAQSFQPTQTAVLNQISLKLKKFGSPPNVSVRILGNTSNHPDKNNIIATGTLSASLVSTNYGWVNVTFNTAPQLTANTTYWMMIDTSSDSSNYWAWSIDTLQGYTRGSPMWSPDWQAKNPTWNGFSGDLGFKTWMGGVATSIVMTNGSVVQGNVHANTINGITINKDAYYQQITNSTVQGSSHPNSADPPPVAMPISAQNITDWQNQALNEGGSTTGNINGCPSTLGPGKIVGNVTTSNNCRITIITPLWITGNLSFGNSTIFSMDPSLGATSGVIIVDGITTFQNSDDLLGTGASGSYLTLLDTYDSQAHNGTVAINTGNSSITGILYTPSGIIQLANNAAFKEVVAWQINMGTGTTLTYDSGLISTVFSAGPSGSFSVIKGTYQLK